MYCTMYNVCLVGSPCCAPSSSQNASPSYFWPHLPFDWLVSLMFLSSPHGLYHYAKSTSMDICNHNWEGSLSAQVYMHGLEIAVSILDSTLVLSGEMWDHWKFPSPAQHNIGLQVVSASKPCCNYNSQKYTILSLLISLFMPMGWCHQHYNNACDRYTLCATRCDLYGDFTRPKVMWNNYADRTEQDVIC